MKGARFPWEKEIIARLPDERRDQSEIAATRYRWACERLESCHVADVGCGYGYGSAILRQRHITVGIDISRAALAYAAQRYPGMYVLANAEAQNFAGFDAVVCLEALSHMLDPYGWIKNLDVSKIVVSAPLTPSASIYPWRKHDIPPEMFRSLFTPRWTIHDELSQTASDTEIYLTIYASRTDPTHP